MRNFPLFSFFLFISSLFYAKQLIVATTTSLYETGLLDVLKKRFESNRNVQLVFVAVGSGMAMKMGARGDADLLLVHSPEDEEKFMSEGLGIKRVSFMYSDFVLVGPSEGPKQIFKDIFSFMKYISDHQLLFVSRADNSGTHKKELQLWQLSGITPKGKWYHEAGVGMSQTLFIANELRAFCLADRATFEMLKDKLDMRIYFEGEEILKNVYSVILVKPINNKRINYEDAQKFLDFLLEDGTLELIENYSLNGTKPFKTLRP